MFFKLIIIDNNPWMYEDMALQVKSMVESYGNSAEIVPYEYGQNNTNTQYVFFGTNYSRVEVPINSILTNFDDHRIVFKILTDKLLTTCRVWDYSLENIRQIRQKVPSIDCRLFEMGYSPLLDYNCGYNEKDKEIDVLFIGSINSRRQCITDVLAKNYNVKYVYCKSGKERADLIKKSRICISIYSSEMRNCISASRFTPILSNNGFIITETCTDKYQNDRWNPFVVDIEYEKLVETIGYYLQNPEKRKQHADRAYQLFKTHLPRVSLV